MVENRSLLNLIFIVLFGGLMIIGGVVVLAEYQQGKREAKQKFFNLIYEIDSDQQDLVLYRLQKMAEYYGYCEHMKELIVIRASEGKKKEDLIKKFRYQVISENDLLYSFPAPSD